MLPPELKDLILDFHASIEEYPKRRRLHNELFFFFRDRLLNRLHEEFSFIFYPGFYQDIVTDGVDVQITLTQMV